MIRNTIATVTLVLSAAGCAATAPTPQLVDARRAYSDLQRSQAPQLAPDEVLTAKQALDRAESMHEDDPGSTGERHYAYLATRQSQLAKTRAEIKAAKVSKLRAENQYTQTQADLRARAEMSLEQTEQSLSQSQAQQTALRGSLQDERDARKQAEATAKRALDSLNQLAKVRQDSSETVITLSGQVLFATGKSQLLPIAKQQLAKVAEALKAQDSQSKFVVAGYTDSVGTDSANLKLSQERAEAVRQYLLSEGVPAARLTAEGKGESAPIAGNDTPEGRANNRRVEIIIRR